jgi:hypothetical protein
MTLLAQCDQDLVFPVVVGNPAAHSDQDLTFLIAQRLVPATIYTYADRELIFPVVQRFATIIQIVGSFQDICGNPISNGYLQVKLSTNANSGGNQITIQSKKFQLDNHGNIINMVLRANNSLSPRNTFYQVEGFTNEGLQFWQTQPKQMIIPAGPVVQNINSVLID